MTTPVLERINTYAPMTFDEDESGFPFDRDLDRGRRDESFRTQLDDIAKRHPEFAEHLEGFPFRSDSLGSRPRRQFAERPFGSGSRFERFDFPFDRDPFEQEQQSQAQQEEPPQQPQEPQPEPEKQERGRNKNIKQSNTADLGQKQEEVNDQRNQRSMSAPPPDNRSSPRFVSSINIPINPEGGMGDAPQPQPQQSSKPTERIIPIHIEGRDEPFFPKHSGPSFAPQPQPERVFGQRPSQFTQFQRESPRNFGAPPDWQYAKPKEVPVQKPEPPQKPPQQKVEPEPEPQPEPEPPKSSSNPIDMIQSIQKDVSALMGQVENFTGASKDKQYIYLDEMLTRNLLKLDDVDTQGQENIRLARREAIKCIQKCINILEAKATANVPKEEKMEVEPSNDSRSKPEEQMEVEAKEPVEEEEKAEAIPLKAEAIPLPSPQAKETENVEQKSEEEKPQESTEPEQNEEKTDDKKDKKKGKKKVAKK